MELKIQIKNQIIREYEGHNKFDIDVSTVHYIYGKFTEDPFFKILYFYLYIYVLIFSIIFFYFENFTNLFISFYSFI